MNQRNDNAAEFRMPTAAELLAETAADSAGLGTGAARTPAPDGPGTRDTPGARGSAEASGAAPHGGLASLGAALGVTEPADARALREAADAEPGIRSRSCLIRRDDETGRTTVVVSVAVAYGLVLPEAAERVRKRVARAAVKVLGVRAKTLTVDVKIVWVDEPAPPA
jgi:hypothetical protein